MSAEHCSTQALNEKMIAHVSFLLNTYALNVKKVEEGVTTFRRENLSTFLDDVFLQMKDLRQQLQCFTFIQATVLLDNCVYVLCEAAIRYQKRVAQDGSSIYWDPLINEKFDRVVNIAQCISQEQYLRYKLAIKVGTD
ncbi:MAG: hypothetical protein XD95_0232 [Microgenomates bacterium 39_7]|nr:MAG: hypothetical protein XD95_0232 [Microgenomates bacterium 39_7]